MGWVVEKEMGGGGEKIRRRRWEVEEEIGDG